MRSKLAKVFIVLMAAIAFVAVAAAQARFSFPHTDPSPNRIDLSKYKLSLVYQNDFSKPQEIALEENLTGKLASGEVIRASMPVKSSVWIAEGLGGVDIHDGKLRVSPLPFDTKGEQIKNAERSHMVVWNNKVFPADLMIEFDMLPSNSTNGLTILFFCATGKNGGDIFNMELPPRNADYKNYHSGAIANYSDAYWSRNTQEEASTNRLRKNPGFALVAEGESLTSGPTDVTHHVRVLKSGGHIEVEINGRVVLNWDDTNKPLGAGRIGFRSMSGVSMIAYDNLKVWKVSRR